MLKRELEEMRRENRMLRAWVDVVPQLGQVDDLVENVKLIPRINEPVRAENIIEYILQYNVGAKAQPVQLRQDTT